MNDISSRISSLRISDIYKRSFAAFCHSIVHQKIGAMHLEIINKLEHGKKHLAVMAARGHFKTYVISRSFPLWVVYKERTPKTIIIISMNQTQSRRILGLIRDELKTNKYFSDFKLKTDNADKLEIYIPGQQKYHTIVSIPLGTRGEHGDYVISDDVMKDEEGRTSASMSKLKELWWKAHFPMAMARGGDFNDLDDKSGHRESGIHLVVGTPVSFDDLFSDLERLAREKDTWDFLRYPAIKADGTPQFPEHYSMEMLNKIKDSITSWAWEQEYMLNPVGSDFAIFSPDLIQMATVMEYAPPKEKDKSYYIGCDIAMSTKSTADNSAFFVLSKAPDTPIKIEEIWHERGVPEPKQIQVIKDLKRKYNITSGYIERKGLSFSMAKEVVTDPELVGVIDYWNPTNEEKAKIIGNLQLVMKHNMLYIPKNLPQYEELVHEMLSFALVSVNGTQKYRALTGHDDMIIGLALAIEAASGWVYDERVPCKMELI